MDKAPKCAICGYEITDLERCPECGASAPKPQPPHSHSPFRPSPHAYHSRGNFEFQLLPQGERTVVSAKTNFSWHRLSLGMLVCGLFGLIGYIIARPFSDLPSTIAGAVFMFAAPIALLLGSFFQMLKSRDLPMITIDHVTNTVTLPFRDPVPSSSILRVDCVTYYLGVNSTGQNYHYHTATDLYRRIAIELAGGQWYELPETPANAPAIARQLAHVLGVPSREYDAGSVDPSAR